MWTLHLTDACWRKRMIMLKFRVLVVKMVKQETCTFSQLKIPAGKGKKYARSDGKIAFFLSKKCETHFKKKRNPRTVRWTQVFRKKKEKSQKTTKKAKKIVVKTSAITRGIAGITLEDLLKKRNEKPEVRTTT